MQIDYRFLSQADFAALHAAFLEAFSDYYIQFQLSAAQLENHIAQNAVELEKSVGAFAGEKMVGFTLNGFGVWNGKQTVYDAGTGVIPEFRGKGIGAEMFEFMMPALEKDGIEQILLEVITQNERAVRLYRKLGFRETRRLGFFEQKKAFDYESRSDFEIREIPKPDWRLFKSFWDGNTSWQNSAEAIARNQTRKIILAAFAGETLVGYGIAFAKSGIIPQLAVDKNHRRKGVASMIISAMPKFLEDNKQLRFSNVDENLESAIAFLKCRNFREKLAQFEMIKEL